MSPQDFAGARGPSAGRTGKKQRSATQCFKIATLSPLSHSHGNQAFRIPFQGGPRTPPLAGGRRASGSTTAGRRSMPRRTSAISGPSSSTTSSGGCWSSSSARQGEACAQPDRRGRPHDRPGPRRKAPAGRHHDGNGRRSSTPTARPSTACRPRRADRHRHDPGAGRHDRGPDAEGQRLPRRGRLGLFQDQLISRATGPSRGSRSASSR
jgi:hypothetical protein